ncbi:hypothetical protein EDB85DRAFT_604928 [Lactarius pseudohatsudake]|nr:hypothetical protein EDB85DRAFT_604928 [Lactarius pseudohatsudake]
MVTKRTWCLVVVLFRRWGRWGWRPRPWTQFSAASQTTAKTRPDSLSVSLRPVLSKPASFIYVSSTFVMYFPRLVQALPQSAAPPTFQKSLLTFREAGSAIICASFYPLRRRQSDGRTSVPTPVLATRCSHQVLRIATGGHLRRALQ